MSATPKPSPDTFDSLRQTIDQLEGLAKSQNTELFERLLTQIDTALSDIVAHLDDKKEDTSLVDAIRSLKFDPQINVEPHIEVHPSAVAAPNIHVSPTPITMQAPEVHVQMVDAPYKRLVVKISKRDSYSRDIEELTITRE